MADDLVSRFTATLDELERVAREAETARTFFGIQARAPWVVSDGFVLKAGRLEGGQNDIATVVNHSLSPVLSHIALWDPQAVLRLVAAMRKIVGRHALSMKGLWPTCSACMDHSGGRARRSGATTPKLRWHV